MIGGVAKYLSRSNGENICLVRMVVVAVLDRTEGVAPGTCDLFSTDVVARND